MVFLGERFSLLLMEELYFPYMHNPLRRGLTLVAHAMLALTGERVTPNAVTTLGLALLPFAVAALAARQWAWCALLLVAHEMVDRLDGSVAQAFGERGFKRDDLIDGAFYDAMVDKVPELPLPTALLPLPLLLTSCWTARSSASASCAACSSCRR